MEAHAKSLAFIGNEGRIRIPFFQRGYVWEDKNWEDLISELLNFKRNHFLGSLILKQQKPVSGEPKEVLVIDGQQRLTTLSILLKAIHDLFSEELQEVTKTTIKTYLFFKKNQTDKNYILKEAGRVKGVSPEVQEIFVLGDELYVPAVRIKAGQKFVIYVVRLSNGSWVVSQVAFRQR